MVPTYLAYLTIFISRNSSLFVATQFNSSWQLSLPYCTQQHFRCLRLSPATRSTTTKDGGRAVINNRKDEAATEKSSAYAHGEGRRKSGAAGCFGMTVSWTHRKIWVERQGKWGSHLPDSPCLTPLAMGQLSLFFPAIDLCSAVNINWSHQPTNEPWQLRLIKDFKDPGVINTRICSAKVCQEHARFFQGRTPLRQGTRLILKNVIRHLPGRGTSLSWTYTSSGVPVKASANRCGENLTITITQCHKRGASGDLTIRPLSSTSEDLRMKKRFCSQQTAREQRHPQAHVLYALNKN